MILCKIDPNLELETRQSLVQLIKSMDLHGTELPNAFQFVYGPVLYTLVMSSEYGYSLAFSTYRMGDKTIDVVSLPLPPHTESFVYNPDPVETPLEVVNLWDSIVDSLLEVVDDNV